MNVVRFLAVLAAGACFSHGRVARAAAATNVSLSIVGCDEARVPASRLVELVRTEVAPANLAVPGESSASAIPRAIEVRGAIELCHGSPERVRVALSVGSETSLERVVDLSDVSGELRARTLAVAFAEMLVRLPALDETARLRDERHSGLAPSAARDVAAAARGAPSRGERAADSRWQLGSGISLRSYTEPQTTSFGPWLALGLGPWQAEALFLTTSEAVAAGTVSLHDLVGALSWAPLRFGTTVRIILGLRAELGMTWAVGSPGADGAATGVTQRRARAALLAEPRLELALSSAISAEARLSAGIAHGATAMADQQPVATSGGPFVGTALGLGVGF